MKPLKEEDKPEMLPIAGGVDYVKRRIAAAKFCLYTVDRQLRVLGHESHQVHSGLLYWLQRSQKFSTGKSPVNCSYQKCWLVFNNW